MDEIDLPEAISKILVLIGFVGGSIAVGLWQDSFYAAIAYCATCLILFNK